MSEENTNSGAPSVTSTSTATTTTTNPPTPSKGKKDITATSKKSDKTTTTDNTNTQKSTTTSTNTVKEDNEAQDITMGNLNDDKESTSTTTTTKTIENTTTNDDNTANTSSDNEDDDYDPEMYRCDVCGYFASTETNPIVICEKCNVSVHRECYGTPLSISIPDDEWVCDRCQQNASDEQCVLCPITHGMMKRTTDWRWAHLSCAQWIPECYYRNPDGMDPIDYLQVPKLRFQSMCIHCETKHGATMQCSQPGCTNSFHITCGMKDHIYLSYQPNKKGADVIVALCTNHTSLADKKVRKKG